MTVGNEVAAVKNVSLAYGHTLAVEDVSFSLSEGEYVCLIGRNGSGKSTLMKGMLGLMKPRAGTIAIAGGPDSTAFLPQAQPGGGDFPATVWEVALSGCQRANHLSARYSLADRELAKRVLGTLGIAELAKRRIGSLSGGQRQRAFLARCLCKQPRLLLLDEPYTGLDPQAADSLTQVLTDLRNSQGIAILMSSHDLQAVAASASRVLVLDRTLQFDGDVGEWLEHFHKHWGYSCRRS